MWRHYTRKWSSCVLAALGVYLGFAEAPVHAQHHGGNQTYDVVQGYIMQCASPAQACAPNQTPAPSAQNQTSALGVAPQAPAISLQVAPAQTPVQTYQLAAAPVQVQTFQLAAAPVQVQTMQLAAAPAQVQTIQLAAAPAQVQTFQLAAAPVQVYAVQLAAQPVAAQSATPVTILLPRHKCHWFCRHKN